MSVVRIHINMHLLFVSVKYGRTIVRLALVSAAMRETLLDCLKDNPLHSLFPPDILDEGAAHVRQRRVSKPNLSERRAAVYVADDQLGRCRAQIGLGPDGPAPVCSCRKPSCSHVAALVLLLSGGEQPADSEQELASEKGTFYFYWSNWRAEK